jgi:hypothetical protein
MGDVCLFGRHPKILHAVFPPPSSASASSAATIPSHAGPSPGYFPVDGGARAYRDAVQWRTLHVLCTAGKKNDLSPSPRNHQGWWLLLVVVMTTHPPCCPPLDEAPTLLHSPYRSKFASACPAQTAQLRMSGCGKHRRTHDDDNDDTKSNPQKRKEKKRVALTCRSNHTVDIVHRDDIETVHTNFPSPKKGFTHGREERKKKKGKGEGKGKKKRMAGIKGVEGKRNGKSTSRMMCSERAKITTPSLRFFRSPPPPHHQD